MTQQETQALKGIIAATGAYYGFPLSDAAVAMYAEDLSDLQFDQVLEAFRQYRRSAKNTRPPLPAMIRELVRPTNLDEVNALEAASRIMGAIAKYGWNNPEPARAYIGELGWRVVQVEGGWPAICATVNQDNIGTLRAQFRNIAQAQITRFNAGLDGVAPGLPEPKRSGGLVSVQSVFQIAMKPEAEK